MSWKISLKRRLPVLAALFLLVVLLVVIALFGSHINHTYDREDMQLTEDAVRKYAVQCYALEGSYPESIEYLADNYTLTLNKDKYVYHYDYIGANMMPDISVFPIEGD
ncbi:MAG: hypothetical protein Q4C25_00545 [Bacillota bacterium]|nr:hypothetical protein [Bacillota bacterium]